MHDVNDVINGLERCLVVGCDDCNQPDKSGYSWDCEGFDRMVNEAVVMLKEQEPRVMTWEEAKASVNDGPFIIVEVRDSTGSELDFGVLVDDSYEMSEGSLLTVEFFPKMEDEYGKRFRMWTSRPTNEQREATPWND